MERRDELSRTRDELPVEPPRVLTVPGGRRQGIFWMLTVPIDCSFYESLQQGELPVGVVWIKGQPEIGANGGFKHLQCIVAFSKKKSLPGVRGVFGTIHAELTISEKAIEYCCKEDTRDGEPFEFGARPFRRNERRDWESIWTAAQSGNLAAIPADVRVVSYRTIRAIASDFSTCLPIERHVTVLWGSTCTGKSRRAWDEAGIDAYAKDPRSKFWDGYQSQTRVVIDEFRGGIDVSHLLRWFDRYPVRLEIKGSSRPSLVEKVWITSNVDPNNWYPDLDEATRLALMRRFQVIEYFP